jgi:hypothetical protein
VGMSITGRGTAVASEVLAGLSASAPNKALLSAAALPVALRLRIAGTTRPHATSHGTCRQSQLGDASCVQEHMPHTASPPHHMMIAQG